MSSKPNNPEQFFKVNAKRQEYLGELYFRYNYQTEICTQIRFTYSEVQRKGRANNLGIYIISKLTLFANYLGPGYLEVVTKKVFDDKFNKIIEILK